MTTNLVSVLIAAHNVEKYVADALCAVMAQTHQNLEIIVIDDGSQDRTAEIVTKLAAEDPRIRFYRNHANLGLIATLNKGLALTNGRYIARTDADDLTEPDWIETLYREMEARPQVLAMSAYLRHMPETDGGHLAEAIRHADPVRTLPVGMDNIRRFLLFEGNPIHHPCALIRSSVFAEHGLRYDAGYPHAEDYKLWLEISKIGELDNFPRVLLHYRLHPQQVSSQHAEYQMHSARRIRREAINHYLHTLDIPALPEHITAADNLMFAEHIGRIHPAPADRETLMQLLYQSLMSQQHYRWRDLWPLLRGTGAIRQLPARQRRKLLKKYLRPQKYGNML